MGHHLSLEELLWKHIDGRMNGWMDGLRLSFGYILFYFFFQYLLNRSSPFLVFEHGKYLLMLTTT